MLLRISSVLLTVLFFSGCSDKNKSSNHLVKVGDSVLTEENLDKALKEFRNQSKLREEFINEWIEKEILYKEALEQGLLDNEEFKWIMENSKKELASAFLINKYLDDNRYEPAADELKEFYDKYKHDLIFTEDYYKINTAYFNNFETAVKFRKLLIESDWKRTLNSFRGDETIINVHSGLLIPAHKFESISFYKVVTNLLPNEVSIVLQEEPSKYLIVQLIEKFDKGTLPQYEMITDIVKDRFMLLKNKELVREFLNQLIEDNNVDIKRYRE
jgi:parvulin-like peptidyl-prolyl isomerase